MEVWSPFLPSGMMNGVQGSQSLASRGKKLNKMSDSAFFHIVYAALQAKEAVKGGKTQPHCVLPEWCWSREGNAVSCNLQELSQVPKWCRDEHVCIQAHTHMHPGESLLSSSRRLISTLPLHHSTLLTAIELPVRYFKYINVLLGAGKILTLCGNQKCCYWINNIWQLWWFFLLFLKTCISLLITNTHISKCTYCWLPPASF